MNYVHNNSKDLVYVLITLGKYITEGDKVFYGKVKHTDLGEISHVLKHLHGRMIMGKF